MVPLGQDQVRFQAAAELDEDIVKGLLVADLGEPQGFSLQKGRGFRGMPGPDLFKGVFFEVGYPEVFRQLFFIVASRKVTLESGNAVRAMAVMAVEVVDDKTIDAPADGEADPRLEHRSPVGVSQAAPVFLHASDAVALLGEQASITVSFEQFGGIFYRFGAELGLVPLILVELEESPGALFGIDVADEEDDVEVPQRLDAALVDRAVQICKPLRAFFVSLDREVRGITLAVRGGGETPEVRAPEADLGDLGLYLVEKLEVTITAVFIPVGSEAGEGEWLLARGGVLSFEETASSVYGKVETSDEVNPPHSSGPSSVVGSIAPGLFRVKPEPEYTAEPRKGVGLCERRAGSSRKNGPQENRGSGSPSAMGKGRLRRSWMCVSGGIPSAS